MNFWEGLNVDLVEYYQSTSISKQILENLVNMRANKAKAYIASGGMSLGDWKLVASHMKVNISHNKNDFMDYLWLIKGKYQQFESSVWCRWCLKYYTKGYVSWQHPKHHSFLLFMYYTNKFLTYKLFSG